MTVSGESLMAKSHQAWKLHAMVAAMVASGALMAFAGWKIDGLTPDQFAFYMLSGVILGLGSMAVACLSIRCPNCGDRWLWRAVSKRDSGIWLAWLESQKSCPACGEFAP